ncbi:MAG: hypothetical protein DHS20C14_20440 [Phycisphaeraceae bacterium]|nr:MAG: hypothetical protein DHS20C14_20440 [Phycisphaeraceae bacterium]
MNKAIIIAAVAGLAGTAAAQSINVTADRGDGGVYLLSETVTWTISVTGLTASQFVQGYDFNINGSAAIGTASTFADALTALTNPQPGVAAGASISAVNGGQSTTLNPIGTFFGDVVIGTFTVHADAVGDLSYSLEDGGVLSATLVRARTGSDFGPIALDGSQFATSSHTVTFTDIPTPASAALLGLGGLVAVRRRR